MEEIRRSNKYFEIFPCPNTKEYCFLQKKVDGIKKCFSTRSIYFTCRYIVNEKK